MLSRIIVAFRYFGAFRYLYGPHGLHVNSFHFRQKRKMAAPLEASGTEENQNLEGYRHPLNFDTNF